MLRENSLPSTEHCNFVFNRVYQASNSWVVLDLNSNYLVVLADGTSKGLVINTQDLQSNGGVGPFINTMELSHKFSTSRYGVFIRQRSEQCLLEVSRFLLSILFRVTCLETTFNESSVSQFQCQMLNVLYKFYIVHDIWLLKRLNIKQTIASR